MPAGWSIEPLTLAEPCISCITGIDNSQELCCLSYELTLLLRNIQYMSSCKLREFMSLTKDDAKELGLFHASVRVAKGGHNVVLQLHGKKEDPESCDTGFFACFFPNEMAKLYCKIGDALYSQGFDIKAFENAWLERSASKNSDPSDHSDELTEKDFQSGK